MHAVLASQIADIFILTVTYNINTAKMVIGQFMLTILYLKNNNDNWITS